MSDDFPAFDLFGEPVRTNFGKRGRPEFEVTAEKRNKVMMLLAFGWKDPEIAGAMGISKPTLRKYFISELKFRDEALSRMTAAHYGMVFEAAKRGNVSAMKQLGELVAQAQREAIDRTFDGAERPSEKDARQPKLGKKEQALLDAQTAGADSDWGDDLNPGGTPPMN